ncbi:MAG: type I restriction-modification system subunit M [Janthinobacterium lividum]
MARPKKNAAQDSTPDLFALTNPEAAAVAADDIAPDAGTAAKPEEGADKTKILNAVWRACDSFRGVIDPSLYKDYILTFLFVKYLSDLWKERTEHFAALYAADPEAATRIRRALRNERFQMPDDATYDYLFEHRNDDNIGEKINIALQALEDANGASLDGVFRSIDFNSEVVLGKEKERKRRLKNLIEDFQGIDLKPSHLSSSDIIGDVYEYLIAFFASDAGKKAGEFYTPAPVSRLLARLVDPKPGDRICDPTCGSASLLMRVGQEVKRRHDSDNFSLYGQELNGGTYSLARMNMVLHGFDDAVIKWGDTLNDPQLLENDTLMKFDVVVANPPFSLDKWGAENAANDRYQRFWRGVPPKSKGDFAFLSHMIHVTLPKVGRGGVILPHGILFRSSSEGLIRRKLIEEGLIEAIIGLSGNMFYGTGIPTAIVLFRRERSASDVLFIDASQLYDETRSQNVMSDTHLDHITATVEAFRANPTGSVGVIEERFAYRADLAEIEKNGFNLNIARYVDTFVAADAVDLNAVQQELETIETELTDVRRRMQEFLVSLSK